MEAVRAGADHGNEFGAVIDMEAGENSVDIGAERGFADAHFSDDLLVGITAEDQFDHAFVLRAQGEFSSQFVPFI